MKKQNDEAMRAFLQQGGRIKNGGTSDQQAPSLVKMRRDADQASGERRRYRDDESRYERQREEAGAMGGGCVGFDEFGHAVSRADLEDY